MNIRYMIEMGLGGDLFAKSLSVNWKLISHIKASIPGLHLLSDSYVIVNLLSSPLGDV